MTIGSKHPCSKRSTCIPFFFLVNLKVYRNVQIIETCRPGYNTFLSVMLYALHHALEWIKWTQCGKQTQVLRQCNRFYIQMQLFLMLLMLSRPGRGYLSLAVSNIRKLKKKKLLKKERKGLSWIKMWQGTGVQTFVLLASVVINTFNMMLNVEVKKLQNLHLRMSKSSQTLQRTQRSVLIVPHLAAFHCQTYSAVY